LRLIATQVLVENPRREVSPIDQVITGVANMQNRTAKFVSAVFASVLAGAPLTTVSHSAVPAADDCLSAPKGQAPQGSHWYYRVDRATKRHCWYVREAGEKLSQNAPPKSARSAKPLPETEPAMQGSIADARAEWQKPIQQPNRDDALAPSMPVDGAVGKDSSTTTQGTETQRSLIASRWPDPMSAVATADPTPSEPDSGTSVNSSSATQPPPALAAGRLTTADLSSQASVYSMQAQLAALLGALAFAGIIGSVIFKFGNARRIGQRDIRTDRRAIWDSVSADHPLPSVHPSPDVAMRNIDLPRELREADDPNGRIESMLARLARSAAN
jgi:hypothetical protein